jgi:hypothetical protein
MPCSTIKIDGAQRDALYEQVCGRFSMLGDFSTVLENQRDYVTAARLAIEFGEDFRLMADLGWNPADSRDSVELTMPPLDLMEMAKRLRDDAKGGLADVMKERDSVAPPEVIADYEQARDTCEEILELLAEAYGGAHHARA